jgi:hypothetical protein
MKAYKFSYMGHDEIAIITNNFTGTGGFDFQVVLLDGQNSVVYNAYSIQKCLDFMNNYEEITIPLP